MPFLGSQPAEQYKSLAKQTITGDGSTAYTLNRSVTNEFDIEVFINNVRQEPTTSYSATGNTITFTAAVTASDSCYIIFQGQAVGTINPPTNSVGTSQIANGGVHTTNIADTAITHAKLHTDMDLSSKTVRIDAMNMGTGTNQWQLATQSAVSDRFALRSTHTTLGDGNPFIIYQPGGVGHQNDALVINSAGVVTQSKVPCFSAVNGSHAVNGDLVFGNANINRGNHYNTSNGRFTAPVTGAYGFMFYGMAENSNTNLRGKIHINGAAHSSGEHYGGVMYQAAGTYQQMILTTILQLNATDYVNIHWESNYGAMHSWHNKFSGWLIG